MTDLKLKYCLLRIEFFTTISRPSDILQVLCSVAINWKSFDLKEVTIDVYQGSIINGIFRFESLTFENMALSWLFSLNFSSFDFTSPLNMISQLF